MPDTNPFFLDENSIFYGAMRPTLAVPGALTTTSDWGNTPVPPNAPAPGISSDLVSTSGADMPTGGYAPYRPTGNGIVRGTGPSMNYNPAGGNSIPALWEGVNLPIIGNVGAGRIVDAVTGLPVSAAVNAAAGIFNHFAGDSPVKPPIRHTAPGGTGPKAPPKSPPPPPPAPNTPGPPHASGASPSSGGNEPWIMMPSPGTSTSVANGMTDTGVSLSGRGPHSYAAGGLIGPDGPVRPGEPPGNTPNMNAPPMPQAGLSAQSVMPMQGGPQPMQSVKNTGKPMPAQQLQAQAQQAMQQNPQLAQKLREIIEYAVSSGEVSQQQLTQMVQLAKVAVSNPAAWSQVRTFAIRQGLAGENDIPQEYDQPLLFILIAIGMAMEGKAQEMAPPQPAGGDPGRPLGTADPSQGVVPSLAIGGPVHSRTIAEVHGGEYVVPADVVLFHGRRHMDQLVARARDTGEGNG